MITGNKGEWSEIYTLLKIISDKELHGGDGSLNKIESLIFPIIKVLRDESNGTFEFGYQDDLVIIKNNEDIFKISILDFHKQAHFLLSKLQGKTERTFSVPEVEKFINSFNSKTLKAKSTLKSDIRVVIHDQRTGVNPELGFSIKSKLGSPSTLLNAGKTTNFIYEIENTSFTSVEIEEINSISSASKIQDRIQRIIDKGGLINFKNLENSIFENNLTLIDSSLTRIASELLIIFFTSNTSKINELVASVATKNPIGYNIDNKHPFYEYKVKKLLTDIALGMTPATVWNGTLDATGGYLIVKEDGDILCYHIYNRNQFEDYLFKNTKLETASSQRHGFGTIYKEQNKFYFKLNLQIRFL
ncbi:MAG: HpaII family restriction endonuclease [Brumimicrobium sp.]|nr:HpaII family restriction endonuclease [Brumimicrobium sp.]